MIPKLWLLAKQKTWKAGIPRYIPHSGVHLFKSVLVHVTGQDAADVLPTGAHLQLIVG